MEQSFYPPEALMKAMAQAPRGAITTKIGFMLLSRVPVYRLKFLFEYRVMVDEAFALGIQNKAGKKRRHQAVRFGMRTGVIVTRKGRYPVKRFGRGWKQSGCAGAPVMEREIKRRVS